MCAGELGEVDVAGLFGLGGEDELLVLLAFAEDVCPLEAAVDAEVVFGEDLENVVVVVEELGLVVEVDGDVEEHELESLAGDGLVGLLPLEG